MSLPLPLSKKVGFASASLCLLVCILVGIGWQFEIPMLKSVVPGYISMKINTAIALALFAISNLVLIFLPNKSRKTKILAAIPMILAVTLGILTLAEYAFTWNLGIDELLFRDLEGIGKTYPPGRLAPITAISFVMLGIAISLSLFQGLKKQRISQALFFVVSLVAFQAIVSYSLGIQNTFGLASHTRVAVHTALALIALCIGFLSLDADKAFVKILFSKSDVGKMCRKLILASILVPALVNFLEIAGLKAGFYEPDFGVLFRVIATIVFFVVMILHNSEQLHNSEENRRRLLAEHIAAVAREESELKLRDELIEAKLRAERASGAKAEFLAHMSHEIRTPLNGIIGIADLMADTAVNPLQKKYVELLQSSGTSLLTIINDILDFSKIEAGKLDLENVNFNLKNVLQSQVELLKTKAHEKGLSLDVDFDPDIPRHVNGDPGRIGQVVLNLIGNAIKFTETGSILVRAKNIENPVGGKTFVEISVDDTGIGLSEETQKKLFKPFVQADDSTSRKFGGTGLGLSISRNLVKLMGGEMGVTSEPGQGSTFWFTTMLNQVDPMTSAEPVNELGALPVVSLLAAGKTVRILVAEDNVVNQMVVLSHLKALGFEGQAVANGEEVIDTLRNGQFDLILMDCQMPEMDGYTATALIRAQEKTSGQHIPIIALTANAMKEDQEKCLGCGMDAYLAKPFKREALVALIKHWLPEQSKVA